MAQKTAKVPPVTFTRAHAVSEELIYIACMPDKNKVGSKFTLMSQYNKGQWSFFKLDFWVQSMTLYRPPEEQHRTLYMMTDKGEVRNVHYSDLRESMPNEQQKEEFSERYRLGRLLTMRWIDTSLYAVGDGGQNYRRRDDKLWDALDTKIFDPAQKNQRELMAWASEMIPKFTTIGEEMDFLLANPDIAREHQRRMMVIMKNTLLWDINGTAADNLYVCGVKGELQHWDGHEFFSLDAGTKVSLTSIFPEDPDTIWVCGRDGILLKGNRKKGFHEQPNIVGEPSFSSMAWFQGKLYLASLANPRGLFCYDGNRLQQVFTGLKPDLVDAHTIHAVNNVLWIVGAKDILRFDGETWERIDHPCNDPIR